MQIRNATTGDAAAIAAIYNHAVRDTTAIWNDTEVDTNNRAAWITERQSAGYTVIVAEDAGQLLGYAAYGPWRAFDGFRDTVEHSVYVGQGAQGRGLGRALLAALITRARDSGLHVMVAGVEAGNAPSIKLHVKLGFEQVAMMPQVGQKFGRWLDLVFLQLRLDTRETPGGDAQ